MADGNFDKLIVAQESDLAGNVRVGGNLTVGDTSFGRLSKLNVAGAISGEGELQISATTTLSDLIVAGATMLRSLHVSGDVALPIDSVDTAQMRKDAVTADKLQADANNDANRAVTTNHIRDNAVTADKLQADTNNDASRAVTTDHIRDGAVNAAKLASFLTYSSDTTLAVNSGAVFDVHVRRVQDEQQLLSLEPMVYWTSIYTTTLNGEVAWREYSSATAIIHTGEIAVAQRISISNRSNVAIAIKIRVYRFDCSAAQRG